MTPRIRQRFAPGPERDGPRFQHCFFPDLSLFRDGKILPIDDPDSFVFRNLYVHVALPEKSRPLITRSPG